MQASEVAFPQPPAPTQLTRSAQPDRVQGPPAHHRRMKKSSLPTPQSRGRPSSSLTLPCASPALRASLIGLGVLVSLFLSVVILRSPVARSASLTGFSPVRLDHNASTAFEFGRVAGQRQWVGVQPLRGFHHLSPGK
jgi:hypothetical protein